MLVYLPLVVVVTFCGLLALVHVDRRVDRLVTHVALAAFGTWVQRSGRRRHARRRLLQSVHVPDTYRMYAAKSLLYATVAAVAGSVLGVYLVAGVLALLDVSPEAMRATLPDPLHFLAGLLVLPELSLGQLFGVLLFSSATLGVAAGGLTYWTRWESLSYRANARERKIDESIARTVAFVYALSRSGMAFPQIMRTLARNRGVFGESAEEIAVAVKSMDLAGLDVLSAIERLAARTPSDRFGEFLDNFASVLRSGQSVPSYLDEQYQRYREDAEVQQQAFLDLLGTLAEAYVSVFVVAPLLFITVLVIMGLMGLGDTLPALRMIAYFAIPLANVGVIVYLDSITETLQPVREERDADLAVAPLGDARRTDDDTADRTGVKRPETAPATRSDGGEFARDADPGVMNFERLEAFERVRWLHGILRDPVRTFRDDPVLVLYVTVPVGLLSVVLRAWPHLMADTLTVGILDDFVVQAAVFSIGTFAVVQELHRRRIAAIEAAVPDFLDRLASVNEAGMSVVESVRRVADGDLGALDAEVDTLRADIEWGVDVETAFYRFEDRLDIPTITRVVTLIANAMHASGDLARVLRIAADEAQDTRRLKRRRRQEMTTYLVVIYLSFLVFLIIVGSLNSILIPNLPTGDAIPDVGDTLAGPLAGLANVDTESYTRMFFHTAVVQALFSGLIAGQMGEGSVRNGAKHAAILLVVAYVTFLLLP